MGAHAYVRVQWGSQARYGAHNIAEGPLPAVVFIAHTTA
jgi:hypothetical protein